MTRSLNCGQCLRQPFPDRTRLFQPLERARRTDPDQVEMVPRRLLPRDRIVAGFHAGGDHVDSFDPGPGSERAVRQEIVAGDDRVGRADRLREPPGPPATLGTAPIVGVAKLDGVVEIVDQVPRTAAQCAQLPARQEFALQDHRVELLRPAELEGTKQRASIEPFTGQRTSPRR